MITLYDYELSGNCYKLRLLMSFLGIEYKTVQSTSTQAASTSQIGS